MEVSNNVSLPSEIVGYVVRVVGQWWARFNDCYTPDIGSGGLIPDMRDDLIDVVQFEPLCGGLDDDTIREFAGLLDSSSFDRVHVLERARQDFRYVSDETELIAFGLCVCVFDAMFPQHVEAVEAALDAVDGIEEVQGNPPDHVDLTYYRSQAHYDEFGRDEAVYSVVNARSREIGAILQAEGYTVRYVYPEDADTVSTLGGRDVQA